MNQFIEQIYRNTKDYKGIVFLDRDGTINEEVDNLRDKKQIEILPKVIDAIRLLNKKNIAVIIITNQPVVARGYITTEHLKDINDTLISILKREHAFVDAVYSCPHHPHANLSEFRTYCSCRKPGLLLYQEALFVYQGLEVLGVVGDRTGDIQAGKNLQTKAVVVKTGYKGEDGKHNVVPDYVAENLYDAVSHLLNV